MKRMKRFHSSGFVSNTTALMPDGLPLTNLARTSSVVIHPSASHNLMPAINESGVISRYKASALGNQNVAVPVKNLPSLWEVALRVIETSGMTVSSTPGTNCMTGSDEGLSSLMIGLRSRARLMSLKAVACAANAISVQRRRP